MHALGNSTLARGVYYFIVSFACAWWGKSPHAISRTVFTLELALRHGDDISVLASALPCQLCSLLLDEALEREQWDRDTPWVEQLHGVLGPAYTSKRES